MASKSMLMLITYTVEASLPIRVWRAMYEAGFDVALCFYQHTNGAYTEDAVEDFRARDRLLDLTSRSPRDFYTIIKKYVEEKGFQVIVQVGFEPMYPYFYNLKQDFPQISIIDMIFNEVGHTVSHFLFDNLINATIVESGFMANFIETRSELARPCVHIAENGIEVAEFECKTVSDQPRNMTIGYVGRFSSEKNPLGFVELANLIGQKNKSWRFAIFGNGPLRLEVERKVLESPIASRITLAGYARPVQTALKEIDILIVPSNYDGRPNIIMEANACGVPVIAKPVGGIPEMIESGLNGYLTEMSNINELTGYISSMERPEFFKSLCLSARWVAEDRFDKKRMIEAYTAIFTKYTS